MFSKETSLPRLRQNGSYVNDLEYAKANDSIKRDSTMKRIQIKYYEKILALCKANHIELFVLMMPIRDAELNSYSNQFIENFNGYIKESLTINGFANRFIDLSNHPDYKDYRKYTDITHLNSKSADEFSTLFFNLIGTTNNDYVTENR